jgi:hypothetical protein
MTTVVFGAVGPAIGAMVIWLQRPPGNFFSDDSSSQEFPQGLSVRSLSARRYPDAKTE